MCVIILCENEFPSLATLESAEQLNAHGGGIAWIENGKVRYKKGIKSKEIFEITRKIQLPAIIHFRIASIGTIKDELCHPFQINDEASTDLSGECKAVLFHNGTWTEWNEICMRAITSPNLQLQGIKFPAGDWSDSRAMAWLADKYGIQFLTLIDNSNKIAVLTPQGIVKFGRFVEVEKNLCSNSYFDRKTDLGWGGLWQKSPNTNYNFDDSMTLCSNDKDKPRSRKQIKREKRQLEEKVRRLEEKKKKLEESMSKFPKINSVRKQTENGYTIFEKNIKNIEQVEAEIIENAKKLDEVFDFTLSNDDEYRNDWQKQEDRLQMQKHHIEREQAEIDEMRSASDLLNSKRHYDIYR